MAKTILSKCAQKGTTSKQQLHNTPLNPNPTSKEKPNPKIKVICAHAELIGMIHAKWIDAAQSSVSLKGEIKTLLTESPASQSKTRKAPKIWRITDSKGFEPYRISIHDTLDQVNQIAKLIAKHGEAVSELLEGYFGDTSLVSGMLSKVSTK